MFALVHSQTGIWTVVTVSALACAYLVSGQPIDGMSPGVLAWWAGLCAVSVFNIGMWRISARTLALQGEFGGPTVCRFQNRQLLLAAVFVLGCAFRSMLPRTDIQRLGLIDSWLSSVLVGRSVATLAELCFAAQWALVLNMIARTSGSRFGLAVSWLLVPMLAVAECCSWYAVLTTAYIGNAIEESIWAFSALLIVVSFASMWTRAPKAIRSFLAAGILFGTAYVAFMCTMDIPMYLSRWQADEAVGRQYLSLTEGVWDAGARWIVCHSWEDWRPEMPWMTLYFSVCVWCSLALVHLPRLRSFAGLRA